MTRAAIDLSGLIAPSEADARLADESSRCLLKLLGRPCREVRLRIETDGESDETIAIPASALSPLNELLAEMAKGNAVAMIPVQAELTTQQAADILNVSRPFLVRLLDEGKIAFRKVGAHRRVRFEDLIRYKRQNEQQRANALDELATQAQALNLGY